MPENKKYFELVLSVQPQDLIFVDGQYGFIDGGSKRAVLHEAQFKDFAKTEIIKSLMWDELIQEKKWKVAQRHFTKAVHKFSVKEIPWKSEPITYNV